MTDTSGWKPGCFASLRDAASCRLPSNAPLPIGSSKMKI
jgi:hypothetical protein